MNKKTLFVILQSVVLFFQFLLMIIGISLLSPNYEKIAFANADNYSKKNTPFNTLIFEYNIRENLSKDKIEKYSNFVNSFNGGQKYYNYGCLWSETNPIKISYDNIDYTYSFSDLSYLEERPSFSTNLLKLTYPSTFSEAFFESKDNLYFEFDHMILPVGEVDSVRVRNGEEYIENNLIAWTSTDVNIFNVDEAGVITAFSTGTATLIASYKNFEARIQIEVVDEGKTTKVNAIPIVIPDTFASLIGSGNPLNSIGENIVADFGEISYLFKVGGYYNPELKDTLFRNNLYSSSTGEYIYFKCSLSNFCFEPARLFLSVGNEYKVNMNMYDDLQYLKTFIKTDFSVPNNMPINNVTNETTLYPSIIVLLNSMRSPLYILVGILFIALSILMFFLKHIFKKKALHSSVVASILTYSCWVILPLSLLILIKKFSIKNTVLFIINNVSGWVAIVISLIITFYYFYHILVIKKEKDVNYCEIEI